MEVYLENERCWEKNARFIFERVFPDKDMWPAPARSRSLTPADQFRDLILNEKVLDNQQFDTLYREIINLAKEKASRDGPNWLTTI